MEKVIEHTKNYLSDILGHIGVDPDIYIEGEDGSLEVVISGDELNFLIGYRGNSLNGLQHILSLSLFNEFDEWFDVLIDINEYRAKKKQKLEDLTKNFIDKVRFFNEDVHMSPMNPYDRKQVHEFVSSYSDVTSHSEGEGYERHVVLTPTA